MRRNNSLNITHTPRGAFLQFSILLHVAFVFAAIILIYTYIYPQAFACAYVCVCVCVSCMFTYISNRKSNWFQFNVISIFLLAIFFSYKYSFCVV